MSKTNTEALAHTVPEACKRLSIGKTKLYELIGSGEIRTFKIGARLLIPESDLQKFIADRLGKAGSA